MVSSLVKAAYYTYVGAAMSVLSRVPLGTNVYERDWDVLLILDTARVDALREVAPEYDFLDADGVEGTWSVGSASAEWIAQTFTERYREEVAGTALVSANAYTQRVLEERQFPDDGRGYSWPDWRTLRVEDFLTVDQPWRYTEDPQYGLTPPRPVTERAVATARAYDPDRLVVHYEQPHHPFVATARREGRDHLHPHEASPFEYIRRGGDRQDVWDAMLADLRWVLDEVAVVLENVDADTVAISADHGNAFGEYGFYAHRYAIPHPHVRRVPWTTTTATDRGTLQPTLERPGRDDLGDAGEQLRALGYRE